MKHTSERDYILHDDEENKKAQKETDELYKDMCNIGMLIAIILFALAAIYGIVELVKYLKYDVIGSLLHLGVYAVLGFMLYVIVKYYKRM